MADSQNEFKKTKAKAMGLKSTLVFDDKIVLTSFVTNKVKNSDKQVAHIEKITNFDGKEIESHRRMFDANVDSKIVRLDGKVDNDKEVTTFFANPTINFNDYIGIKGKLENKFFDKEFPMDNVHIQIAYNIIDIKKILALYVNNIIFALKNVDRNLEFNDYDIVGTAYTFSNYETAKNSTVEKHQKAFAKTCAFLDKMQEYGSYFPGVFTLTKDIKKDFGHKPKKEELLEVCREKNYRIVRALSLARQLVAHASYGKNFTNNSFMASEETLYNLDQALSSTPEIKEILETVYFKAINEINKDFTAEDGTAKNNLYLLTQIYPNRSLSDLTKEYYLFVVYKEQNNLGVNVRKIRENICKKYLTDLEDKEYDTYRSKLYTLLNFVLSQYLKQSDILDKMVAKLRSCIKDFDKEAIYIEYSDKIWDLASDLIKKAILSVKKEKDARFKNAVKVVLNDSYTVGVKTNLFVKFVFFLTKFLDGKEINELLCALINKFDNINDLLQTANKVGNKIRFAPAYRMFENSGTIANDIRIAKNIARMKPEANSYKAGMVIDALDLLNTKEYASLKNEILEDEDLVLRIQDEIFDSNNKGKKNHKMLNFIINNVINSKWFVYIVKYNNPKKCANLMRNRSVLDFVIKDIPDEQIKRYYSLITGKQAGQTDIKVLKNTIVDKLYNFSIDKTLGSINNMSQDEYKKQVDGSEKELAKALVSLYLTVAYLLTKSMVKVNTRFAIAFSCLERDSALFIGEDVFNNTIMDYLYLTKRFVDKDKKIIGSMFTKKMVYDRFPNDKVMRKKLYKDIDKKLKETHFGLHNYQVVSEDLEEAKQVSSIFKGVRDTIMHLNVVSQMPDYIEQVGKVNSYYGLYCGILQRMIINNNNIDNDMWRKFKEDLSNNDGYSKDFMKVICTPFAYNMARFKNLSMENIFYDDYVKEK